MKEKILYTSEQILAASRSLSDRILKDAPKDKDIILIGIATGGLALAEGLSKELIEKGRKPLFGILDITFYRDDLALRKGHPVIRRTEIPFDLDHQYVVLVDDVLFSGRTIRAAMDALTDYGRPETIRLAVLIDRGHRELPIHPNFVGYTVQTKKTDRVRVDFEGQAQVVLEERNV